MGKVMDRDPSGRTVLIKGGRLSFGESLKDAQVPKNAEPGTKASHGVNVILEADSPNFASNQAAIVSALKAASMEFRKRETFWKELWDDNPKQLCFRKGEKFKNAQTGEIYTGYEGNLVVVGKGPGGGARRPQMKDRYKRDVGVEDILDVCYNGTYGDFIVSFYGTDKGGTSRITCSVEAIRSWQEGERMGGGGIDVQDDDFDDLGDLPGDDDFGGGASGGGGGTDDLLGGSSGGGSSDDSLDLLG